MTKKVVTIGNGWRAVFAAMAVFGAGVPYPSMPEPSKPRTRSAEDHAAKNRAEERRDARRRKVLMRQLGELGEDIAKAWWCSPCDAIPTPSGAPEIPPKCPRCAQSMQPCNRTPPSVNALARRLFVVEQFRFTDR